MRLRLRESREARFLTQRDLAKLSGVSAGTIARLETERQSATFTTIRKLAAALDVEPEELVIRDEKP